MLQEEECSSVISWTKESDLEFEIKDMGELAQLWGMLRGRPEMDKKSFFRAFRYYYKINVIKKVCLCMICNLSVEVEVEVEVNGYVQCCIECYMVVKYTVRTLSVLL